MDENSNSIHPERLKCFVRHVCVIAKKHKDREVARSELGKQIERVKRFSSKKKEMDKELNELNRKISLVLEKEMQLVGFEQGESAASKSLMRNVIENKEKINQVNESINDIKKRLQDYVQIKTEREGKIDDLERKIRAKTIVPNSSSKARTNKKENVSLLKSKLKKLEDMYNKLKNKGVNVSRVESRIEDLRLRLMG